MSRYKIADLIVEIEDFIALHKELEDFRYRDENNENIRKADIKIAFKKVNADYLADIINRDYKKIIDFSILSIYESADDYIISYKNPKLLYGYGLKKNQNTGSIWLTEDYENYSSQDLAEVNLPKRDDFSEEISGQELLLYAIRDSFFYFSQGYGRIAVHSSSLIYKNKVWLFSASSGVGKSTHTRLWQEAGIDCDIFNGDVAMCYEKDGKIMAGGLPWCGTSKQYKSFDLELGGIMFLRRADENRVIELGEADAALSLNARCLTPNWNRNLVERNISACESIIPQVLTGLVYCRPDIEAAENSRKYIDEHSS